MSAEYVVLLCICCFALGTGFGMVIPFIFCALHNKVTSAFDLDLYEDGENV